MNIDDSLSRSVDEYFYRMDAGERPSPFDFEISLGPEFAAFLRAVEAKSALQAAIEPQPERELSGELGHFSLVRKIAHGGGGVVYEARDERTGERVGLKVIHPRLAGKDDCVRRFQREGELGQRLSHPHLLAIRETGSVDEQPYCSMEFVDGPTLRERLSDEGRLEPTEENLRQFVGIADGLVSIHRLGILHRDVKPSNILIRPDGEFVLGDFGLARDAFETSITQPGEAVGTLGYMSPEQLRGDTDSVDGRTDVYALGATLYAAFTGEAAFERVGVSSLLRPRADCAPPDPRSIVPSLSPALCSVIMTALERRPEDRYQSIEAMRDDLLKLAGGGDVDGRPVSPARRWVRRHRATVSVVGLLLLALGAYGVFLATRSAELRIQSYPSARVLVDGELRGSTPIMLELSPGKHEIVLECDRFKARRITIALDRGPNSPRAWPLEPLDPNDAVAERELARSVDLEIEAIALEADRGAESFPLGLALLPRGRCRPADCASLRFESTDEQRFPVPATLLVRRGEEVLYERTLDEVDLVAEYDLPGDVVQRLRSGDTIEWGIRAGSGEEFWSRVEVLEESPELQAKLAHIEEALEGLPQSVLHTLRAAAYLDAGWSVAALREAGNADASSPARLVLQMDALQRMGMADSRLGDRLYTAIATLPADVRSACVR